MKIPALVNELILITTQPWFFEKQRIQLFTADDLNIYYDRIVHFKRDWQVPRDMVAYRNSKKISCIYVFFDKPIQGYDGFITV